NNYDSTLKLKTIMNIIIRNPTVEDFNNLKSDVKKLTIRKSKIIIFPSNLINLKKLIIIECDFETEYFEWPNNLVRIEASDSKFKYFPDRWPDKLKSIEFY